MNRFYVVLTVVAVVLGITVFMLLRTGGGAPAAAAGPPPTVADDGFRGYSLGQASAPVEITEYLDFECIQAGGYPQRIESSRKEGDSLRVDGTPTFFANGKKLDFRRLPGSDDFKAIADSIIAHARTPKPRS